MKESTRSLPVLQWLKTSPRTKQGGTPANGTQVRSTGEADPKFHHAAETTVSVGIQWCQQEQFRQDGRCAKQNNCRRCRNMLPSEGSGYLRQSSRKGNIPRLYCFWKSKEKSLLKDGRWNKNMHAADTDSAADCKTGIASLEIFILRKMDRNIIWLTPWVVGRDWRWSWIWDHHTAAVILLCSIKKSLGGTVLMQTSVWLKIENSRKIEKSWDWIRASAYYHRGIPPALWQQKKTVTFS